MTDCKNLDLARQWAADIDADRQTLSQDTIDAAADLISSLPDAWVDADKLREVIDKLRGEGDYVSENLADELAVILPAPPAPRTLADMSPEERAECQWMQADLEGVNGVIRVIVGKSYTVTSDVLLPSGAFATVYNEKITPLHDLPPMKWPGNEPEDEASTVAESENVSHGQPEPQPGEAWLIDIDGEQTVALLGKVDPADDEPTWLTDDGCGYSCDSGNPVARLVPETTEQDDGPEFDPAYTYRDKSGNKWAYMGDAWRWVDSLSKEHGLTGYHTPPADYGPYTRIEA